MTDHLASPPIEGGKASRSGRPWIWWVLILAVGLAAGYALFVRPFLKPPASVAAPGSPASSGRRGGGGSGPVPVTAETARKADLNVRLVSLGTVTPLYTVTVRSRVDGELQKIYFKEGTEIAAGEPLADLDPRPFEVLKLQAEAQLAKDNALLDDARLNLVRYQTLLDQDSVSKQQVDTQASLVRQYEAAIKVDDSLVNSASLQLSYAHITAPISGRIGLRSVDQGNIVHASDTNGIAVITQLHPITVLFSIPQDAIPKVMKSLASDEPMVVEAFDQAGHTRLATGKLTTVDNQIDPTTGTVKLRAEFANADGVLFPNQFVNIQLVVEKMVGATVVPTAAVQRGTAGTYVYVVQDQATVSMRPIETGASEQDTIAITKGLAPGEVVVVDGIDKLREGARVELVSRAATTSPDAAHGQGGQHTGKSSKSGGKHAHSDSSAAPGAAPQ